MTLQPRKIEPYKFHDWATMRPGMLVGGFIATETGFELGPSWQLPSSTKILPYTVLVEGFIEFREKILQTHLTKSNTAFYYPNYKLFLELISDAQTAHSTRYMKVIKFKVGEPIGMFLGHIIRVDGITKVNILTLSGFDVWI